MGTTILLLITRFGVLSHQIDSGKLPYQPMWMVLGWGLPNKIKLQGASCYLNKPKLTNLTICQLAFGFSPIGGLISYSLTT